ncbi:TrkH family potassium uptake protein [Aerococcaceae bacterium WGS1372]
MRRSVIAYIVGRVMLLEAALLLLPVLIGVIYQESSQQILSYLSVAIGIGIIGLLFSRSKPEKIQIKTHDGIITVAILWILISFFGALPLVFTGEIPNIIDAFFEISSGFTTTGSSIITDLSALGQSTIFWRSFTHFIGGMGVLVFMLAILPSGSNTVNLMKAEVPGPVFGKLLSRTQNTARTLYLLYTVMTIVLILILIFLEVPVFDAFNLAFGTAGTGGFSISNDGFTKYTNQAAIEWVIGIGMLLFGVNFNVYYYIILGYIKDVFKNDEELRYYILIVLTVTALIIMNTFSRYNLAEPVIRNVFFTVASIITTTGYATADFTQWPLFSHILLMFLMFCGGCAGSTAGGLKVSRVIIYFKSWISEIRRAVQPKRMVVTLISNKPITKDLEMNVTNYLLVYIVVFIAILLSVSLEAPDFETAFSTVAATFNNIGPGFGQVGPTSNFSMYSNWNTFVLSIGMIAGRLEIYLVLILFSPRTLRHLTKGY